jgi:acyl-CoA hydrolase
MKSSAAEIKRAPAKELPGRPVSASRTEMTELVLPQDANLLGNILGGRVMHLIDIAGAISAHRHCHRQVVTASVDHLDFLNPVRVGDLIVLEAQVNRAFHTSVEVGVEVFRRIPYPESANIPPRHFLHLWPSTMPANLHPYPR